MQATDTLMRLEPLAGRRDGTDALNAVKPLTSQDAAEAQLVRASVAGDQEAFGSLVRRHQARVFSLAGRFFRQPQDVEEVAQETFLRAWLKIGTYGWQAPFEHWLTRLCMRCAYDRLRRRSPRLVPAAAAAGGAPAGDADAESPAGGGAAASRGVSVAAAGAYDVEELPEARAADPNARLEVERLLATLPPADRFLLVLLEIEGWPVAEIAEQLGLSRVNVKVRAHRARQRLRRVLEEG